MHNRHEKPSSLSNVVDPYFETIFRRPQEREPLPVSSPLDRANYFVVVGASPFRVLHRLLSRTAQTESVSLISNRKTLELPFVTDGALGLSRSRLSVNLQSILSESVFTRLQPG